MVFENLTLIELNLENSRFSASRGGDSAEETASDESEDYETHSESETESEEASGGGGRSKALPLGVLLFLVVGALAFRRFRSGGEETDDVDEAGGITIEQAAEQ